MTLDSVRHLVKDDLEFIDQFIVNQLQSHIPLVKEMIEYVMTCGGKRVRPMISLLSAHALANRNEKHIHLAAVIELTHTATLLHDDVVDSSTLRRGNKTANTIWGSNASVLVGDFLYSRAFQIVVGIKHEQVLDVFAKATHYIAEGEILQLINCNNPDTDEDFYFDIIKRKTAKLFEIASHLGAVLSTSSERDMNALRDYGANLGLAYQLIDDALDYSQPAELTGKNLGQDITDGKATLPLIHAMKHCKAKDLQLLRDAIESSSSVHLNNILEIIEYTDAIKYTADRARHHANLAQEALQHVAASPYKNALISLCDFVVERKF